ncbi:MAG: ATP-binding cassette domain-containing protein [Acidobacteriota bacterium]|nr:ATP-binding cassette domain-containing protein [Acidobacteriota bacterium]MDQ3418917.1 ATP-binding cassette domain-containing protein [Acidobacteriota bacterium]
MPVDEKETSAAAVEFENVSFAFDDHVILRDVSFTIQTGTMTVILGESGVGKSVLLKLILGLLCPDSGIIRVNGERVDNMREQDLIRVRGGIGMVFQELALFDSLTVAENVGYRLSEEMRWPEDKVRSRVEDVLGFIGLGEFSDRKPSELSGGQRRRVAIGRAVAPKPNLILFDDPTTGLDPIIAATVNDEIVKLRDLEQVTALFVTQQIRDAFYIARHHAERKGTEIEISTAPDQDCTGVDFMLLRDATIHFRGSASELMASEDDYLREFLYRTLPPW